MREHRDLSHRVWLTTAVSMGLLLPFFMVREEVRAGRAPLWLMVALGATVVSGIAGCSIFCYVRFLAASARNRWRSELRMLTSTPGDRVLWCLVVLLCLSGLPCVAPSLIADAGIPREFGWVWVTCAAAVYPVFLKRLVEWASELAESATERPTEALPGSC